MTHVDVGGNCKFIYNDTAEEIKNIVADPKMAGRSIGVVSLIGAQQAKAIQEKLLFDLGEDKYQAHDIACGDATAFQGKEHRKRLGFLPRAGH